MAMDIAIRDYASGVGATVDANNDLSVNLPTNPLQSGFVQDTYVRDAAVARTMRVSEEGESYGASARLLFYADFNGATLLNNQFNTTATTMTVALTAGFARFNGGLVTTTNIGAALTSARSFSIEDGQAMRIKAKIRHTLGAQANKQFDFGLGMYAVAANQAGAMIEFIGYRWSLTGQLLGVLGVSSGGAVVEQTTNINGAVPLSDNVTRTYEVVVTSNQVEFWINNVFQSSLALQNDAPGITKQGSLPIIGRMFIATATALASAFDVGEVSVTKLGPEADVPVPYRQALMGRHSSYAQTGLVGTTGNTAVAVINASAPAATAGTNAVAASTGLGGNFALTATNIGVANNVTILNAYQNPAFVIAAGAATNGRNLVVTDINIGPLVVTTVIAGGGAVLQWFVAIGNTAVTHATTDAIGTTAIGSKAPRYIMLGAVDVMAAAAAVGTVLTRTGNNVFNFNTPLVIHPGEFISIGVRTISGTAVTSGVIQGGIGYGGYWD